MFNDNKNKTEEPIRTKKIRSKLKLQKNIPILLFSFLAIAIMGIIFFITYDKYEDLTEVKFENYKLYQYFGGMKYEYTGELAFKNTGEISELKYQDIEIRVDSTPIYFSEVDNEMLLPVTMGYYIPRISNKNFKLPVFTKLGVAPDRYRAYVIGDKENVELETSFLYDGVDLYVFLFETPVTINGETVVLSPLSYISVVYDGDVIYYNKSTDEYREIPTVTTDVVAEVGDYKLNLSTDMIMYTNSNRLLIKNVKNSPSFIK